MTNNKRQVKTISTSTKIGRGTKIGFHTVIGFPKIKNKHVQIGQNCSIGNQVTICTDVRLGKKVIVGDHSFISCGAVIQNEVFVDTHTFVGDNVVIGEHSLVLYGARIYDNVQIGENARIAGFVAENTFIGNYVSMFGSIIHPYRNPKHWNGGEKSPIIEDFVVIGFNSTIVGNVKIGHHVYIAA